MLRKIAHTLIFFIISSITLSLSAQTAKHEMRGVWIATVANIDWPSSTGLSSRKQKLEIIKLLDEFKANNINTIIFQARPCADAFYQSSLEPWSVWLSGVQGNAPAPFYDPLEFLIQEAHQRCMEVHVWINPYRALNSADASTFCPEHIYHKKKNLFVKYANKYYFNPGLDETREYLNSVVREIVEKYDIDAIHCDDYFYPYPAGKTPFPDQATFKANPRGFTHIDDWRRDNVTMIIKELRQTIKETKPWVNFGISPFGIWRNSSEDPRGSNTKGISNYDQLYADILLWMKEGYIDYVVPQLYWEIGKENVDYHILLDWWNRNSYQSNLYIGMYASGFVHSKGSAWRNPNELVRQLYLNREQSHVEGEFYYSANFFVQNIQGLNDSLKTNFYQRPALVPPNKIKTLETERTPPPANIKLHRKEKLTLAWDKTEETEGRAVSYYVVYAFEGKEIGDLNNSENIVCTTSQNEVDLTDFCAKLSGRYTFTVTAVNRYRLESIAKEFVTKRFLNKDFLQ